VFSKYIYFDDKNLHSENIVNLHRNSRNLVASRRLKTPLNMQGYRRHSHNSQLLKLKHGQIRYKLMLQSGFWRCDFGTENGQIRYKLTFRLVICLTTCWFNLQ